MFRKTSMFPNHLGVRGRDCFWCGSCRRWCRNMRPCRRSLFLHRYTFKRIKNASSKFGIQCFFNTNNHDADFLCKATHIKWLPFVLSILTILYVWFVASHAASFLLLGCHDTISKAKVLMKIIAPNDLLSKYQDIFDPVLIMFLPQIFFSDLYRRCFVRW